MRIKGIKIDEDVAKILEAEEDINTIKDISYNALAKNNHNIPNTDGLAYKRKSNQVEILSILIKF